MDIEWVAALFAGSVATLVMTAMIFAARTMRMTAMPSFELMIGLMFSGGRGRAVVIGAMCGPTYGPRSREGNA